MIMKVCVCNGTPFTDRAARSVGQRLKTEIPGFLICKEQSGLSALGTFVLFFRSLV